MFYIIRHFFFANRLNVLAKLYALLPGGQLGPPNLDPVHFPFVPRFSILFETFCIHFFALASSIISPLPDYHSTLCIKIFKGIYLGSFFHQTFCYQDRLRLKLQFQPPQPLWVLPFWLWKQYYQLLLYS